MEAGIKNGELEIIVALTKNGKSIFNEYTRELERLDAQGLQPIGINEHLDSFKRYLEWKEKTKELFDDNDSAKDLI